MKKVDAIIVGQGLAGTCMAVTLQAKGKQVCIIDPGVQKSDHYSSASRSAAGLFNPVTGRKMVKTWMADQLFAHLAHFYKNLEKAWNVRCFHELPIYRPFQTVEDQNDWVGAEQDPEYKDFIEKVLTRPIGLLHYADPYGGLLLRNSGYLDVPKFLDAAAQYFKRCGDLHEGEVRDDNISISSDGVIYRSGSNIIKARWVIYCRGVDDYRTKLWSQLKFKPVKGEWLNLDISLDPNYILNRGVFMIPREGMVRVGATYDHASLNRETTEKGQKEILERMSKIYTGDYRILDQKAGIRPATYDRKPFVGVHPDYPAVTILNGLGAKGVTLAPFFAEQLAGHLIENAPLLATADIRRCF